MRIIALEEHIAPASMKAAWAALPPDLADDSLEIFSQRRIGERLEDLAEERIRSMDDVGVDVQVLSLTTPGTQPLDAADAVALARNVNDLIAATVAARPDRFQGFATLPTPDPEAAALELERAVGLGHLGAMLCGRTRARNMDAPENEPIHATAARLGVPLYIHPQLPVRAVRDAYYSGFGDRADVAMANGGFGWHVETGMQLLRLVLSGTLDRHPDLQLIVGHWGEVVLFYLDRVQSLEAAFRLDRPLKDYFRQNVSYTPSGILSQEYANRIRRPGVVDAWTYQPFLDAVLATGRNKIIMCGLCNDVCIVYPAISATEDGFEVQVVADAGGSPSKESDDTALQRMREHGVTVTSTMQIMAELATDWAGPTGVKIQTILYEEILKRLVEAPDRIAT